MYSKMTSSLIVKTALTLALVGGFATTASAQVGVTCQYFTGQFDPLAIQSEISAPFWIPATAVQTNLQTTRILKASGIAEAELNTVGAIDGGFLVAEVDAKFKQLNNDPGTTCPNSATVRGAGELSVGEETLALRFNSQMSGKPDFEVIVAGGVVRARDRGIVGEATLDLIAQFKVDFGVIGISGIDADGTLFDFDYREVRVARAIMEHSRKVYLAADHSKFGRNALVRLAHIGELDALFTDRPPPDAIREALEAAGGRVFIAEPQAPGTA